MLLGWLAGRPMTHMQLPLLGEGVQRRTHHVEYAVVLSSGANTHGGRRHAPTHSRVCVSHSCLRSGTMRIPV